MTILRPERSIPVWETYDVAVAGGGVAGVAAALAAARNGARTCLIEKYAGLGGLATLGHIIHYLPICDGRGRQVSFGIAEELLKAPMHYSTARPPEAWLHPADHPPEARAQARYALRYDPGPMSIAMDFLLEAAGVEIIYDTVVVDTVRASDGAITHLIVENKSGCGAFAVKTVLDGTGEADVCHMCGEPTETYTQNVRAAWFYAVDADRKVSLGTAVDPYWDVDQHPDVMRFDGTDWRSVSRQIIESRKMIIDSLATRNAKRAEAGESPLHAFYAPYFHGFRTTRHLVAGYVMSASDLHVWHDDAVGLFSDWRKAGPVYAMPYRALLAGQTPNLMAIGRCFSATGDTWDITRVIPVCAVSGEAAGVSAALAVEAGCGMGELPVGRVQTRLREQGVVLDPERVRAFQA